MLFKVLQSKGAQVNLGLTFFDIITFKNTLQDLLHIHSLHNQYPFLGIDYVKNNCLFSFISGTFYTTAMNKYLLFSLFFVLILLYNSCKKADDVPSIEEENNKVIKEYASWLVSKKWLMTDQYTKYGQKGGGFIEVFDYLYNIPSCQKDDFIRFNDNGTYTVDHGIEKCTPDETQTFTGYWKMEIKEGTITKRKYVFLTLDPSVFGLTGQTIEELTDSKLVTVSDNDETTSQYIAMIIRTTSFKNIP